MKDTKIITFQNMKGGCGKSTLCTLLAGLLVKKGKKKVMIVDADYQETIWNSCNKQSGNLFEVTRYRLESNWKKFNDWLQNYNGFYDYILIDTQGSIGGLERAFIVQISDLVIVPLIPSEKDVKATMIYLDVIEYDLQKHKVPVIGIINKHDHTIEAGEIKKLDNYNGMTVLKNYLSNLVIYRRRIGVYETVINDETRNLFKEIKTHLK